MSFVNTVQNIPIVCSMPSSIDAYLSRSSASSNPSLQSISPNIKITYKYKRMKQKIGYERNLFSLLKMRLISLKIKIKIVLNIS